MLIFTGICGVVIGVLAGQLLFHARRYSPGQILTIAMTGIFIVVTAVLANML